MKNVIVACMLSLMPFAAIAQGLNLNFQNGLITDFDLSNLFEKPDPGYGVIQKTLEGAKVGDPVRWRDDYRNYWGEVVVTDTYYTTRQIPCRIYIVKLERLDGVFYTRRSNACRMNNGVWENR